MGKDKKKDCPDCEKTPKGFDKVDLDLQYHNYYWGRHKWYRILFDPLLSLTCNSYKFYKFSQLPKEKRVKDAEGWAKKFRKDWDFPSIKLDDVIGRDDEKELLLDSIYYHVIKDPTVIKYHKRPPPKVFVLKGGTGTGKTYLAQAISNEAFERGIKEGVVVKPRTISAPDIFSMFYGQSASQMSNVLESLFETPTVILIDEAQEFVTKDREASEIGSENTRVKTTLLKKVDKLKQNPIPAILIFSTDSYENLLPQIRRRSRLIDLDQGITEEMLLGLCGKKCVEHYIELKPEKILDTIQRTMAAIGHTMVTPDDVDKTFNEVIGKTEKPLRGLLLKKKKLEGEEPKKITEITLDDFAEASKVISSYREKSVVEAAKESERFIMPTEKYSDIGGLHGIKEPIIGEIGLSLNPEKAKKVSFEVPRGYLFYGPPGTGKTYLTKAIAGENKVPFFLVKGSSVYRKWVGESEQGIRDIFRQAKKKAPSMIFFDEIDAIAPKRGGRAGDAGVGETTLMALMAELDGWDPTARVVFIGATNRPDILDDAIHDRLDRQFEFPYPKTTVEKKEILDVHLRKSKKYIDKDATTDNILKIFLRKAFSPRTVADTLKLARNFRALEIYAASEIVKAKKEGDLERVKVIESVYPQAISRIMDIKLGGFHPVVDGRGGYLYKLPKELPKEFDWNEIGRGLDEPEAYPLRLYHIETAFQEKIMDERWEELKGAQRLYRKDTPEIGLGYGIGCDEKGGKGIILPVQVLTFPSALGRGSGKIKVFGTVRHSVQEAAEVAREFLRQYCPNIYDFDISIHVPNPAEGSDEEVFKLSGPSLGMQFTTTMASSLGKFELSPDVCITGKIALGGEAGIVGGIQPERGSAKIDVSADEKFEKVLIPDVVYKKLETNFKDYMDVIKEVGSDIVGYGSFFKAIEMASYSHLSEKEVKKKLWEARPDDISCLYEEGQKTQSTE